MSVMARLMRMLSPNAIREAFWLDADWYLAHYPDVQASGMNPRLHYLRYGRAEGRRSSLSAKTPYLSQSPRSTPVERLSEKLWAGFAHRVAPELEALADAGDGRAAWELALWAYANGRVVEAQEWLKSAVAPRGVGQMALALAKCGMVTLMAELETVDRVLVEVNQDFGQALAPLNRLYRAQGLAELTLRESGEPLSLDNLRGHQSPEANDLESARISVVMCAHNAARTLPTALDSVLAQSWRNLEVLVVDDASTDETAAVVKAYQLRDDRVRLLRITNNLGAYGARNRGAREARGDFVTVHDSDDWSHPQKLERQMAPLLADPSRVASASRWVRVQEPFTMMGSWQLNQGFLELNPSSWLVRRAVFDRTGYWDAVRMEADTEFAQRLEHHYGHEALVTVLPEVPLAFARLSAGTLTQQTASHLRTQFYGLRRVYAEAGRWWHRTSGGQPVMPDGPRPFPVPVGGIMGAKPEVTRVLVANFALQDQPELPSLLAQLEALYREGDALLHWPDATAWAGNTIADEVFAWAQQAGVAFAHAGLTLTAKQVLLLQPLTWHFRPSPTVALPELREVLGPEGRSVEPLQPWLEYFRSGGEGV
ncbi:glycosyltransferase family 2 protein [Marinimicrobium koreense]|uniref:glycosyltransferase family 2 protein n=1 Tax=Marinimicrobium koreense TaxID=306545 RepID=UPI003F6F6FDF